MLPSASGGVLSGIGEPAAFDLSKMDTSHFECLSFQDGGVYFGEITVEADGSRLRHGKGIQMYTRPDGSLLCKYEGEWVKGKKTGKALVTYPDGSIYDGTLINDLKEGYGTFIWPNGDSYSGSWESDKMSGQGTFKHREGKEFEGHFKNNYVYLGGTLAVNPFLSLTEIEEYKHKQDFIQVQKEDRRKNEKRIVEVVKNRDHCIDLMVKAKESKMLAFLVSTKEKYAHLSDILSELKEKFPQQFVFDVVKANSDASANPIIEVSPGTRRHKETKQVSQYMLQTKHALATMMAKGGLFVISLDETPNHHPQESSPKSKSLHMALPAVRPLFDKSCFPSALFNPADLDHSAVFDPVLQHTDYAYQVKSIHKDFHVLLWGKYKLEGEVSTFFEKVSRKYGAAQGNGEGVDLRACNLIVWGGKA